MSVSPLALGLGAGALAIGGLVLARRAQAARPAPADGAATAVQDAPLGLEAWDVDLDTLTGPTIKVGPRGNRSAVGEVKTPQQPQDDASEERTRCNRTIGRLCRERPLFCAGNALALGAAGVGTVLSGGIAAPTLAAPVAAVIAALDSLPCEED